MEVLNSLDWDAIGKETVEVLQRLLRFDTQNYGSGKGSESACATYVRSYLLSAGVECSNVLEKEEGRGNIIARIRAGGSERARERALILVAHLDVVPAPMEEKEWKEEGWKCNPFGGEIIDDTLYGRGAVDMKNMAAMCMVVMKHIQSLLTQNPSLSLSLSRDIVFIATADEESGSERGAFWLVREREREVAGEILITEVGGFSYWIDGREIFPVQIAEKGTVHIRITAHGKGGHGSVSHPDSAVSAIGRVVHALGTTGLRWRVRPVVRDSLRALARCVGGGVKGWLLEALVSERWGWLVKHILPSSILQPLLPLLSNMANPTLLFGSRKLNQVPPAASVECNGRLLPGVSVREMMDDVMEVIGRHHVRTLTIVDASGTEHNETISPSPHTDQQNLVIRAWDESPGVEQSVSDDLIQYAVDVINRTIKRHLAFEDCSGERSYPAGEREGSSSSSDVVVMPTMVPGATDARAFKRNPSAPRLACLGFSPVRLPDRPDRRFGTMFHGVNECIPVAGLRWGVRVLMDVVWELARDTYESQ